MSRILLMAGKGGVGKTTTAAATGLAAARQGHRTLVISFDLAHSLFDSFDLDRSLFDQNQGDPVAILDNLDIQEIDVQEEIERHWGEVYRYTATLFSSAGTSGVVAEEVAIIPGMEDVVALMYLNDYVQKGTYDVIVLDCPPTSESLRFVSITSTLEWYMLKRYKIDRTIVRLARPLANALSEYNLPDDNYFQALWNLFQKIDGVKEMLIDPGRTTVRLVTNAEKMVIRETQRAYMYFSLYGVTTDRIIINRVMPESENGYFAHWARTQAVYVEEIGEFFAPVPVSKLPMFPHEVVGLARLQEVADALYRGDDPARFYITSPPYGVTVENGDYLLRFDMPFADKEHVDVARHGEDLIIRVGSFKRHVPLPRSLLRRKVTGARLANHQLVVRFSEEAKS